MIRDHLGNEYSSISEMCAKYGIKKAAYMEKLMSGMAQEEIFTSEHSKGGLSDRNNIFGPMADRIMTIRLGLGMSQKEFGAYLGKITGYGTGKNDGLTLMMVSSVENSRRCFDLDVYIALAKDQNVSLDYLFGRVEEKKPYPMAKGYRSYYERVQAITDKVPKLRNRGSEARLAIAEQFNVPIDYLCGLTEETKMHKPAKSA